MPSQNNYYQKQSNTGSEQLEYPEFFLKVRDLYELDDDKLEVLSPENPPQEPKRNLLMILTPVFLMLILMIFVRSRMTNGGMMYILYFAASMTIGGAMSVWAYFDNGKDYKKKVAERKEKYNDYIDRKIDEIEKCRNDERIIISRRNPSIEETVNNILEFSPDLFAKRKEHKDYLDVRIGTGTVKSLRQIEYKKQEYVHVYDELIHIPEQIHDKYEYISDMPVVLPLGKVNAVGFVGNRTTLYQIMKNVILTIAGQESFTEVRMVFLLDEVYAPYLKWVRWLPNTYDSDSKERNIMYDDDTSKIVLGNIYAEISRRETMSKEEILAQPDYIVFAFRSERLSEHPVSKYFDVARSFGFTFIFFEESESLLHKSCAYTVALDDNFHSGMVKEISDALKCQVFTYQHVSKELAEQCARKLAPVYIKEPSLENNLTKNLTFYQLLGIKNVREISLANRWNNSKIYQSMAAPLGVKSGGEIVSLDIHERFHGPHGLVAGTTGSGKSEILQSYILSMATLFHPYEVGFIIIDFKGGGMANQFKNLPHLNGAITNIDGKQINRSLMSIKAELIKRQELFAKYDVNRIDDYIKLYKNKTASVPLPHLILIVDEFAELKSEQPEFMKELISAARIGRSLGVHLILATQKPAGVVNDQIWSNSKFKLCLKVQDKTDSNEVLKSPLAAEIREPGRAYLQVGNNEIFELFQSAYSGAYISDEHTRAVKKFEVSEIDLVGRKTVLYSQKPSKNENTVTELDAIVEYIHDYCKDAGIEKLQEICLPPLSDMIPYPEDIEEKGSDIVVPIGLFDDPARQMQKELTINLTQSHVFILGSSLSGKTYLIQNMIYGLTTKYSPDDVNIYILDFASMIMKAFEDLKHVGSVITLTDEDKLKHFLDILQRMIEDRREVLSNAGLSSYSAYREAGYTDMPQIVVFLENYTAFKEEYADLEVQFIKICRDGVALGISVVITNQQMSGIGYRLLTNFATRIAMNCNDNSQYSMLIDKCRTQPDEMAGRGLITIDNEIMEFQTYLAFSMGKEVERISKIKEYIKECNGKYSGGSVEQVDYVPDVLTDSFLIQKYGTSKMVNYKLIIGLGFAKANIEYDDLLSKRLLAISGRDELGREDFVYYILNKLCESSLDYPIEITVIDDEKGSLSFCRDNPAINGYFTDKEDAWDVIDRTFELALARRNKKMIERNIDREPFNVIVFGGQKAPDVIAENKDTVNKFSRLVKSKEFSDLKISFIFADVENVALTSMSNQTNIIIRNCMNTIFFENIEDIRFVDIPVQVKNQVKDKNSVGDAFYISDGKIKRVKTVSR